MKCTKCGSSHESEKCPKCENQTEAQTCEFVCDGVLENGQKCKSPLTENDQICPHCTQPVHRTQPFDKSCSKCGTKLTNGKECTVCIEAEDKLAQQFESEEQFNNLLKFENKLSEDTYTVQESKYDISDEEYEDALSSPESGSPQESEGSGGSYRTACLYPSDLDNLEDSDSAESDETPDRTEDTHTIKSFINPNAAEKNVDELSMQFEKIELGDISGHEKKEIKTRKRGRKGKQVPAPEQHIVKRQITEQITVVFHVLFSSKFLGEENTNGAFICLKLGGKGMVYNEMMTFKRYVDKKYAEFEFRKELFRTKVKDVIFYSYGVNKGGVSKVVEEDYYFGKKKELRYIEYIEDMNTVAVWHQYDGVATVDPTSSLKDIFFNKRQKSRTEKLRQHAFMFAREFCPSWFKQICSNQEITETFQESSEKMICLIKGLDAVYQRDNRVWLTPNEFTGDICQKLFEPAIENLRRDARTPEELYSQQITALAIIDACNNVNADMNAETRKFLCQRLLPDISSDDILSDLTDLITERSGFLRMQLVKFILKFPKYKKDPSWMYLLPLLHIGSGYCAPYEEPSTDITHKNAKPNWWGTVEINKTVQCFKEAKDDWQIPIDEVVSTLMPFFKMDYYLSRSFLACLVTSEIQNMIGKDFISLEACCASLQYWNFLSKSEYTLSQSVTQNELAFYKGMQEMRIRLERQRMDKKVSLPTWEMTYKIAIDGVDKACNSKSLESLVNWVHIFLTSISQFSVLSNENTTGTFDPSQSIRDIERKLLAWTKRMYSAVKMTSASIPEYLKMCDSFICQISLFENAEEAWNTEIKKEISKEIMTVRGYEHVLLKVFCSDLETFSNELQTTLTEITCEVVLNGLVDVRNFQAMQMQLVQQTLSDHFTEQWQVRVGNEESHRTLKILQHGLEWPAMKLFYRSLGNGSSGLLSGEDNHKHLSESIGVLREAWNGLLSGHIRLNMLEIMCSKKGTLVEVISLICEMDSASVEETIELRSRELQVCKLQKDQMKIFVQHCENVKEAVNCIIQLLRQQTEDSFLDELCTTQTVDDRTSSKQTVTYIGVDKELLDVLPNITERSKSRIFEHMWFAMCSQISEEVKSIREILELLWKPVSERYIYIKDSIASGNVEFCEFEQYIQPLQNDIAIIQDELVMCGIPKSTVDERIKQFLEKKHLDTCNTGAEILNEIKQQNNLRGNFTEIDELVANFTNLKMKEWRKPKVPEFLEQIDDKKTRCLKAYAECYQAVQWIRNSMGSGGRDLNVFVDLAMMSAGEVPINITKVQCLHSSATGYAPLLFHIQEDFGYVELIEKCEEVWKNLDKNPKLPEQLRDTSRELLWLEEIHKTHGAVETTSLKQAEMINKEGKYVLEADGMKGYFHQLTVEKVLKLIVPKSEETKKTKTYSYSEVEDLQSRLMLVMGKSEAGNIDVDKFVDILNSLVRLGNVFIKLCSAGCVLFNDLKATFRCNANKNTCLTMRFGQKSDLPMLRGRQSSEDNLDKMIPAVAEYMESCLAHWYSYIKETRKKYFHLNFFTIDQLVILQKELVQISSSETPLMAIYDLLSNVKSNCCLADLVKAMDLAKKDIQTMEKVKQRNMGKTGETTEEDEIDLQRREEFVEKLLAAELSEDIARRYVDEQIDIRTCVVDDAVFWCMDNQNEEAEITPSAEEIKFSKWCTGEKSVSTLWNAKIETYDSSSKTGVVALISALKELWDCFLSSITDSTGTSDYLNLEHLGIILKHLAGRDEADIRREVPANSMENEPNVILCKSDETLTTALSIYMHSIEQPLPSADEVLLCTHTTNKEEVEIFLRRSMNEQKGKLHCLVNADLLDFDVSEAAGHFLEECVQEKNYKRDNAYRLFIICRRDNENRSPLVSSLQKYIRADIPIDEVKLSQYILSKFSLKQGADQTFASNVDVEKSNARAVLSQRAGVGKSLFVKRVDEKLRAHVETQKHVEFKRVTVPLQEKIVDLDYVTRSLIKHAAGPEIKTARLFHIDISHEVQEGIDNLLFNLLILNCLKEESGLVWRRSESDIYLIEHMPKEASTAKNDKLQYTEVMFRILPQVICRSPNECLSECKTDSEIKTVQLFDEQEFRSDVFQRPFQYLKQIDEKVKMVDFNPISTVGTRQECLQILLRHCGIPNPSWAELHHFVWFLNTQLIGFENNAFVSVAAAEDLPGFGQFVLKFLIQMSKDFSNRSLNIGDESSKDDQGLNLETYELRRKWESSPHPYLFFNSDGFSFTFLGFNIDPVNGNLIDQQTGIILEERIMTRQLYTALVRNQVDLREDFDALTRERKIEKLINVMGGKRKTDPDPTYELTTDNVKKILAIFMRFKCDIPVIVMGETGCGKTRLIKFMCSLQVPDDLELQNTVVMKVHGGTTHADIANKVEKADQLARKNAKQDHTIDTVLFFDEANTTEAIGLLKEIMCDRSLHGKRLDLSPNLKIVAACNPYRRHSDKMIEKLEHAGLGYHVQAGETADTFGQIPLRRLVYRVHPLPQSLRPLVWDFGQLTIEVEELYINQMVKRYIKDGQLPSIFNLTNVLSKILTESQLYMRKQADECSFVSLRDVERVLFVMSWFYSKGSECLFPFMNDLIDTLSENENADEHMEPTPLTRSLILALGVCYHACLKSRQKYRETVQQHFSAPFSLRETDGAEQIRQEIECCQNLVLNNVNLAKNIARNTALKENVFMMVICIELRIPLFLVGKPGSSKSLAKTIVADAMQGNSAHHNLFKNLKQTQMVSFQCSPLATPDGIVATFRQCSQFQKDRNLSAFVSTVVLDEVGLAEDSPRMPLKTLHPLLEDGCQGDEIPEDYMKVAFIGLSNWSLDPAKMNRGIFVQRDVPDEKELNETARGICGSSNDEILQRIIDPLIEPLATSYLHVFNEATVVLREFYGLRDFYSLIKMLFAFIERSRKNPTWCELEHCIKRNFGGLPQVDSVKHFRENLQDKTTETVLESDPDCSHLGLINACIFGSFETHGESRYPLLLADNLGAVSLMQQHILSNERVSRPIIIFGSSFRGDQEYTQICRNINKIKVCMETGNTVVLLNLENLYVSLYDALNQYYVYFGGQRFVDLGLGTHRVKCQVHPEFRLIVVAEKLTVYKKFPIPLINRLEKHFLTSDGMLDKQQTRVAKGLENWAKRYVEARFSAVQLRRPGGNGESKIEDGFISYNEDTCSGIILQMFLENKKATAEEILEKSKLVILSCATPECVVRNEETEETLAKHYFDSKQHDSLVGFLDAKIKSGQKFLAQITTHSKLLSGTHHKEAISEATGIKLENILFIEALTSLETEQQFSSRIQQHLHKQGDAPSLILIQCAAGDENANLIDCARFGVLGEMEKMHERLQTKGNIHCVIVVQLPRKAGGCFKGFQCGTWESVHIDDLHSEDIETPQLHEMRGISVSSIFTASTLPTTRDDESTYVNEDVYIDVINNSPTAHEERRGDSEVKEETNSESERDQTHLVETSHVNSEKDGSETPPNMEITDLGRGLVETCKQVPRIRVKGIVVQCVQSAAAMVKDISDSSRGTKRVEVLLKNINKSSGFDQNDFLHGLQMILAKLLTEKEQSVETEMMAKAWMSKEAAATSKINKAGTLRNSCHQVMCAKVTPVFAGLIAYLDTDKNLDIIESKDTWRTQLWLKFINTPRAIDIKFDDIRSTQEDGQIAIGSSGYEGHLFSATFPFSWVISRHIDAMRRNLHFKNLSGCTDNKDKTVTDCKALTLKSGVGKALYGIEIDDQDYQDIVDSYVEDYLHTLYNSDNDIEFKLVLEVVRQETMRNIEETKSRSDIVGSLICAHLAVQELSSSLADFRLVNSIWPDCSPALQNIRKENPDNFLASKEAGIIFPALCLMIESLTPKQGEEEIESRKQWLERVNIVRPVIEKVLSSPEVGADMCGSRIVIQAKHTWNRVMVMKLFIENICIPLDGVTDSTITWKRCGQLWTVMGDNLDCTTLPSFVKVEKFLTLCNKKAFQFFYGTDLKKCTECGDEVKTPPVFLPCSKNHIVCEKCYEEIRNEKQNKCSTCKEVFPVDWEPTDIEQKREEKRKLVNFQEKCNSFLMAVISQLCFSENKTPCQEIIEKLFGYITCSKTEGRSHFTKEMTMFNTGIDRSPVFRSYLIQLLVRCSEEAVTKHLQQFFDGAVQCIKDNEVEYSPADIIELCLLFIQCIEDSLMQKAYMEKNKCEYAAEILNSARKCISSDELNVDMIYSIAKARTGLRIVADYMNRIVKNGTNPSVVPQSEQVMFDTARYLCKEQKSGHASQFLVKNLCRTYGLDIYMSICGSKAKFLKWIKIHKEKKMSSVDRFVVCGKEYKDIRKCILSFLHGERCLEEIWRDIMEITSMSNMRDLLVQLSIYREVTGVCVEYPAKERTQQLTTFIEKDYTSKVKESTVKLLRNEIQPLILRSRAEDSVRAKDLKCLIIHFLQSLENVQWEGTFVFTFVLLLNGESNIQEMFLPTMPQDDREDVKQAIQALENEYENTTLYCCPNGHQYAIGDCGRPWTVDRCRECGAEIGGTGHVPLPGNNVDDLTDQTKSGHLLGPWESRGPPVPERKLTVTTLSITRIFLHMALLGGAGRNKRTICGIFKPEIDPETVEDFLWKHIQKDFDDLQQSTKLSFDDTVLLMHSFISSMVNNKSVESAAFAPNRALLTNKNDRQAWEVLFTRVALDDTLKNVNEILGNLNKEVAADDPFHCIIHDIDRTKGTDEPTKIAETSKTWRYRTPVSIEHLQQDLEQKKIADKLSLKILSEFLQEDHALQALRFVPNIMKLHRILLQKYNMKLDRSAAKRCTVRNMKTDKVAGTDTETLLRDFSDAWEITRHYLQKHVCNTEDQRQIVQKEFCMKPITDDTPLSFFLPATHGQGLCSYALIDFLLRKQNSFLDECGLGKRKSVKPTGLTTAHLISYDHENDIIPLIIANCQSTFVIGQENRIEYDFEGLQRQLVDQYLISKSNVDIKSHLKIDTMQYVTEVTRADAFKSLQEKIQQVELGEEHKHSIIQELQDLPDLCNSIDQLVVTINFLRTLGGDANIFLNMFMTKTLLLEKTALCSQKARQVCTLGHVRSLWLLFSLRKSMLMVDRHFQHDVVFEHIDDKFHQPIPDNVKKEFEVYVRGLPEDMHAQFVSFVHECLLLHIATSDVGRRDDPDYVDTSGTSLRDTLTNYNDENPDVPFNEVLGNLPNGLLQVHTVYAWIAAYIELTQKMYMTRRHDQRF
ncbi:E3 ubiquitin-protein ligase rnf213-alpha-like isoform X1 [Mya arenaria]|uniref:E3 ubiquitin-protein ligase rnf213-alpha-like isoform X1 n=1 Tax=Mya arenaria TaxID=6604 RepID=UPI0022E96B16|nr:E3 ubiquitin-protein ligase rnf213-alpha-like isoform X1 [Mya arenaria]